MKGLLLLLVAGGLVVIGALVAGPILERNRWAGQMRALRSSLDSARVAADSCKISLAREEEAFLAFDETLDSLRSEVSSYEDPEQGGVPEAEYSRYLQAFQEYNQMVEEWQIRADTLQAREVRCRSLVEAHNLLGDSIRALQASRQGGNPPSPLP